MPHEDLHAFAAQAAGRARRASDGRWRVVREVRSGDQPVLVVENEDREQLAVKIVRPRKGQMATCPAAFPPEAVNILPVLGAFAWADGYGLVMPLAETSLRTWLREEEESNALDALLAVLTDVARALASIEGNMVHGDVKPENILRHAGNWCLADFGPFACPLSLSERGEYSLTPAYAAPEQWRGLPVTSRTDIYAFGVMAFELLNGIRPFPGPERSDLRRQHLFQTAPRLLGMPASITRLVAACLSKHPAERPTAAETLAMLERGLGGLEEDTSTAAVPPGWSTGEDEWPTARVGDTPR